jgi:hypothetical protein
MIAIAARPKAKPALLCRNEKFLSLLPEIQKQAGFAFRRVPHEAREELVEETIATAYDLFTRLCLRGKRALACPTPLTKFAVRHVREGRRIGSRCNSRDVMSPRSQASNGIVIERLDQFNPRRGEWREVLVEDHTAGPAETAVARIDWAAWLGSLSRRQRMIACTLASGETTGVAARKFRISAARISQLRAWFRDNWNQFHGETLKMRPTAKAERNH